MQNNRKQKKTIGSRHLNEHPKHAKLCVNHRYKDQTINL